jgi:hypothetical protein
MLAVGRDIAIKRDRKVFIQVRGTFSFSGDSCTCLFVLCLTPCASLLFSKGDTDFVGGFVCWNGL